MRYTVTKSIVQVIGPIWMPNTMAAMTYELTAHDLDNARDEDGQLTRESVQNWLDCHAGDFQYVTDFQASLEDGDQTIDLPWMFEDSEITFNDCVYGDDDA